MVRLTDRSYMTEILLLWHKTKVNKSTKWRDDAFSVVIFFFFFFFCERTAAIKRHFFTIKHHTDVIVSNLQHRFFLSVFRSETAIRDRRDRSVRLNMLLLLYLLFSQYYRDYGRSYT